MAKLVEYITPTWIPEEGDKCIPIYDPAIDGERIELVRCKDCKHMERLPRLDDENSKAMVCNKHVYTGMREEAFFCADGERR